MFFKYNSALGPPYNVIVDTNFINFSIKNKLEVVSAMMDCLLAKCESSCRLAASHLGFPCSRRFKASGPSTGTMALKQEEGKTSSKNTTTLPVKSPDVLLSQAEQRNDILDEYFASTKLLQVVQDFMKNLANTFKMEFRLPANPYPELLKTIRMHELRQASVLVSSNSTSLELSGLNGQTSTPPQFQVCFVEHEQFALSIWGVKTTLEQLTGTNLNGILELVNLAFQTQLIYKDFTDDDCRVTSYGVLVGNSIFGARLQEQQPCFIELETHVFVSGVHLEKTMAVFARFLLKQLLEAVNASTAFIALPPAEAAAYRGCIMCDGIAIIPQSPKLTPHQAASTVWTLERAMESRIAFVNAVKTALVSNSLITLNRYDSAGLRNSDESFICQAEQVFFFHFVNESGSNVAAPGRSFIVGSRALTSGIFFDSKGALEIVARFQAEAQISREEVLKKQPQKKKQSTAVTPKNDVANHQPRPRPGFAGILENTVCKLRLICLTKESFRQQMHLLVGCYAYNLGYLAMAYQILENIACRPKCSVATMTNIRANLGSLDSRIKRFLEELDLSPPTSVMYRVSSLFRHFYCHVRSVSALEDERSISELVEALRNIKEMLLIVIRVGCSDFLCLVRSDKAMVSPASPESKVATDVSVELQSQYKPPVLDEIDVLRSLEMAIEERKYPPSIVAEVLFAQSIIESCLDVALESAVMNTVAVHLPPNPFVEMSKHLQVFALRQLIWKQELQHSPQKILTKAPKSGSLVLFLMKESSICAINEKLLQLVSAKEFAQALQWLADRHVLHEGSFKPSKSSYSVAIFPMLLVFHPLLFAQASSIDGGDKSLLKQMDIVEHYVVEGKDFDQARSFFIAAVVADLRRIAATRSSSQRLKDNGYWQVRVNLYALGPNGQKEGRLNIAEQMLDANIEEVVHAQLVVRVAIHIAELRESDAIAIHKVTKTYLFHHHSTDGHDSPTSLSPLISIHSYVYNSSYHFAPPADGLLVCVGKRIDMALGCTPAVYFAKISERMHSFGASANIQHSPLLGDTDYQTDRAARGSTKLST
ncbi:unnamed protein product [Phytophthora lilii]|uniref:Unnamed protein product n=1 Tax=Phytophthora lilii TaxID=2077276 RepID=A0A9W6TYI6_9STRA|nr:unnamed protein product [Phytophthora lilii]